MGVFKTAKVFPVKVDDLGPVAEAVLTHFKQQGYEVEARRTSTSSYDVSISKGGVFKAVLGMKTALKIHLETVANSTSAEAGIGIFGKQAIPTVISMLLFWPVLITQIWGMVQQSKLDTEALGVVEIALSGNNPQLANTPLPGNQNSKFCPSCGSLLPGTARFCQSCGAKL
jgi:zinc-ribbon domain